MSAALESLALLAEWHFKSIISQANVKLVMDMRDVENNKFPKMEESIQEEVKTALGRIVSSKVKTAAAISVRSS